MRHACPFGCGGLRDGPHAPTCGLFAVPDPTPKAQEPRCIKCGELAGSYHKLGCAWYWSGIVQASQCLNAGDPKAQEPEK